MQTDHEIGVEIEQWRRVFKAAELALARADGDPSASTDEPDDPRLHRVVDRLLERATPPAALLERP